jgi:hypothetical protein
MSYYQKYLKYKNKYIELKNNFSKGGNGFNGLDGSILKIIQEFSDCTTFFNSPDKNFLKDIVSRNIDLLENITIEPDLISKFQNTKSKSCLLLKLENNNDNLFCNLIYNKCFVYTFAKKFNNDPNLIINKTLLNVILLRLRYSIVYLKKDDQEQYITRLQNLGADGKYNILKRQHKINGININIPNTIQLIDQAVYNRSGLYSVNIPNSVIIIGSSAFFDNYITQLIIPDSVFVISDFAFTQNKISELKLSNTIGIIGERGFQKNNITDLTLPASLFFIGEYAFYSNKIKKLTIPKSVIIIGDRAFCDNPITHVNIPSIFNDSRERIFGANFKKINFTEY